MEGQEVMTIFKLILQNRLVCYDQEANVRSNETIQVFHILSTKA